MVFHFGTKVSSWHRPSVLRARNFGYNNFCRSPPNHANLSVIVILKHWSVALWRLSTYVSRGKIMGIFSHFFCSMQPHILGLGLNTSTSRLPLTASYWFLGLTPTGLTPLIPSCSAEVGVHNRSPPRPTDPTGDISPNTLASLWVIRVMGPKDVKFCSFLQLVLPPYPSSKKLSDILVTGDRILFMLKTDMKFMCTDSLSYVEGN